MSSRASRMVWPQLVVGLVAAAAAGLALAGCGGCGAPHVAELAFAQGQVQQDEPVEGVEWRATEVGDRYATGAAVRTGRTSEARVKLGRSGGIKLAASTTVRFLAARPNRSAPRVAIDTGQALLEAADEDLFVVTDLGEAEVQQGARVRLDRGAGGAVRLEVLVGVASIEPSGGGQVVVHADESVEIAVGRALVVQRSLGRDAGDAGADADVRSSPVAADDAGPLEPEASDAGARIGDGGRASDEPPVEGPGADVPSGPSRAALSIGAGESPIVHDPGAPTPVRVRFGAQCSGEGVVEILGRGARASARGTGAAVVVLPTGSHRYRVRCLDGRPPGETHSIRISRDSGSAGLPRSAPRNTLDADGRRYTVLYQNLHPILTFRWPRAPAGATAFVLRVQGPRGARTVRTREPRHTLGSLGEGSYTFSFAATEGAAGRSPETSLRIDFDNATPAARLMAPSGSVSAGSTRVAGVVLRGASVTAGGQHVAVDGQGHFDEMVPVAGEMAFVIRIAHPERGVHYYLRRLAGP